MAEQSPPKLLSPKDCVFNNFHEVNDNLKKEEEKEKGG